MNNKLTNIGIIGSIIYCIAFGILVRNRIDSVFSMPLNELGDFFAGSLGPLAIFWLILGFLQQGIELKQNTTALELQAEELKNSVEQQKELVKVSEKQFQASLEALNYEREMQRKAQLPFFIVHGAGATHSGQRSTYNIEIRNVGGTATHVQILFNREMEDIDSRNFPSWDKGLLHIIKIRYPGKKPLKDTQMTLSFVDSMGVQGFTVYNIIPLLEGTHPSIKIIEASEPPPPHEPRKKRGSGEAEL